MKKGILILGKNDSGKTHLASIFGSGYKLTQWIDFPIGKKWFSKYDFQHYDRADCIVIENVPIDKIEDFFNFISDGVLIQRKGKSGADYVHPKIILTCNCDPVKFKSSGASFKARFDVIRLKYFTMRELSVIAKSF